MIYRHLRKNPKYILDEHPDLGFKEKILELNQYNFDLLLRKFWN